MATGLVHQLTPVFCFQCDEATPECSQCRESGRTCPGSVDGLIFISMGEKSQKRLRPSSKVETSSSSGLELSKARTQPCDDFQLPPAAKSLVAGAAEQSFLGCFMSCYHTGLVHWPSQTIQNPNTSTLKLAVRAG